MLEQTCIMLLDLQHVFDQSIRKFGEIGKATKACKALQLSGIRGQTLRLFISNHLQAVLDGAQKNISSRQIFNRFFRHPTIDRQFLQHVERSRTAQLQASATKNQLLRLHKKLDFANSATTKLHIMPFDLHLGMSAHGMYLALHRVNIGNRPIVEIFAPDEGGEISHKLRAQRLVACHWPRLDQRRTLPILSEIFIIRKSSRQRNGDRRRAGIGAQAQINAQNIAIAGALL